MTQPGAPETWDPRKVTIIKIFMVVELKLYPFILFSDLDLTSKLQ